MTKNIQLPFFTLLLLISFASVNAVLFTPALPNIASFFKISEGTAQQTITWFLIGYAIGQLIYSPLANRFGRKPALYTGISLQIVSSLLCVSAGIINQFWLLTISRLLLALGSGVGLKMTFTLVNECYEPKKASQMISYLMLAFAVTPGLGILIGGFLNAHFGWVSCFYACALYGVILLLLTFFLPETQRNLDLHAFKAKNLIHAYIQQFKNPQLIAGGLLMGAGTSFIYVFSAITPFIAITIFGMSSQQFGSANLLPPIGLIIGSLFSAKMTKKFHLESLILTGIVIALLGTIFMLIMTFLHFSPIFSIFFPAIIIYCGLCFVFSNASSLAMSYIPDKAYGAAVMNFINMGLATCSVLSLTYFPTYPLSLPITYLILNIIMGCAYKYASHIKT